MGTRRRVAGATAVAVVVGAAALLPWASAPARASASAQRDRPIARSVVVRGHSMYVECRGSGRPVVVMDAGMGNDHTTWAPIEPAIRKLTRVCTYDRAGEGASVHVYGARTSRTIVEDLRRLLAQVNVAPPYVLVGHSFGGLNMRLYAGVHPRDVAGLVLENATGATVAEECRIAPLLCQANLAAWSANGESVDYPRSAREVRATHLPRVPLVVVVSAESKAEPLRKSRVGRRLLALWHGDTERLAHSVPGGRLVTVPSGHFIHAERPAVVVAAIRDVLTRAR